jgi:threonine dehydratase
VRGALNALLSLSSEQRTNGVVAASSGNHGAAVAWALRNLDAEGIVFVPEHASPAKVEAMRRYGADVRMHGQDTVEAEAQARAFADQAGLTYLSPYNDPRIIAGQGTVGVELYRRLERIDAVFVPVGGGGLISGIAGYLKALVPGVRIVGCQPSNSPVMARSVAAGHILDLPSEPTLSDGTAGGIEPDAITFELCRALVDEFVLVSEDEIAAAMRLIAASHHLIVEGSSAVAVAAYVQQAARFRGQDVVIVLTGANVSPSVWRGVL